MVEVRQTQLFTAWLDGLSDRIARARVVDRIERMEHGNPGDVRPVGEGVSEMRIDHGPGCRVYFTRIGSHVVLLLAGGDKRTQRADIQRALRMARDV